MSHDNNNKVSKKSEEEELGRENTHDYIRKNDGRIHYIDDYSNRVYTMIYEFAIV